METISQFIASNEKVVWGWIFLLSGSISFLVFLYAAIISKLLPSENAILSAISNDRYYCFLVPMTVPILVFAVYLHWLSMKLFKHAWSYFSRCGFHIFNWKYQARVYARHQSCKRLGIQCKQWYKTNFREAIKMALKTFNICLYDTCVWYGRE